MDETGPTGAVPSAVIAPAPQPAPKDVSTSTVPVDNGPSASTTMSDTKQASTSVVAQPATQVASPETKPTVPPTQAETQQEAQRQHRRSITGLFLEGEGKDQLKNKEVLASTLAKYKVEPEAMGRIVKALETDGRIDPQDEPLVHGVMTQLLEENSLSLKNENLSKKIVLMNEAERQNFIRSYAAAIQEAYPKLTDSEAIRAAETAIDQKIDVLGSVLKGTAIFSVAIFLLCILPGLQGAGTQGQ